MRSYVVYFGEIICNKHLSYAPCQQFRSLIFPFIQLLYYIQSRANRAYLITKLRLYAQYTWTVHSYFTTKAQHIRLRYINGQYVDFEMFLASFIRNNNHSLADVFPKLLIK